MSTVQPPEPAPRVHTSTMIAGALVLVGLIAAAVTLGLQGWEPEQIGGLLVMVGTAGGGLLQVLNKLTSVQQATEQQNAVLATISHNTNGVLTDKIRTGVREMIPEVVTAVRAAWDEPVPYTLPPPPPDPTGPYRAELSRPSDMYAVGDRTQQLARDIAAARHRDPLDDVA